jgi:hypothetical protein
MTPFYMYAKDLAWALGISDLYDGISANISLGFDRGNTLYRGVSMACPAERHIDIYNTLISGTRMLSWFQHKYP